MNKKIEKMVDLAEFSELLKNCKRIRDFILKHQNDLEIADYRKYLCAQMVLSLKADKIWKEEFAQKADTALEKIDFESDENVGKLNIPYYDEIMALGSIKLDDKVLLDSYIKVLQDSKDIGRRITKECKQAVSSDVEKSNVDKIIKGLSKDEKAEIDKIENKIVKRKYDEVVNIMSIKNRANVSPNAM